MSEVGCHNCIGACCTALMELPLSAQEAGHLVAAGTVVRMVIDPKRTPETYVAATTPHESYLRDTANDLPEGVGLFQLLSNCAFLEPVTDGMAKCRLFGDP